MFISIIVDLIMLIKHFHQDMIQYLGRPSANYIQTRYIYEYSDK